MSANFEEARINDNLVIYGTIGGSSYKTTVAGMNSGFEQRNSVWTYPRWKAELGDRLVAESEAMQLRDFFNAMGGMAIGFRCKDWLDYRDDGIGILGSTGLGDGSTHAFQMSKRYTVGSRSRLRQIKKPVSGTVKIFKNGVDITSGCSIDTTTGMVSINYSTVTAGCTVGTTTQFSATGHGLTTGKTVYFTDAVGADRGLLVGNAFVVTVIDANNFTIPLNTVGKTITAGVYAVKAQPTDTLTWTGEFDIPVRFNTDDFEATFSSANPTGQYDANGGAILGEKVFYIKALPVIEVRI